LADTELSQKWPIVTKPIKTELIFNIFCTTTLALADTKLLPKWPNELVTDAEPKDRLSPIESVM